MPRGGKRPGTGTKKGEIRGPYKATINKEQAREALRAAVLQHMDRMVAAQVAHSIGIGHLYTRDQHKKFTRIENAEQAHELLTTGTEGQDYWIFMKDPSVAAFTDLMNRAIDKPIEPSTIEHSGNINISCTWKKPRA